MGPVWKHPNFALVGGTLIMPFSQRSTTIRGTPWGSSALGPALPSWGCWTSFAAFAHASLLPGKRFPLPAWQCSLLFKAPVTRPHPRKPSSGVPKPKPSFIPWLAHGFVCIFSCCSPRLRAAQGRGLCLVFTMVMRVLMLLECFGLVFGPPQAALKLSYLVHPQATWYRVTVSIPTLQVRTPRIRS